MKEIGGTHQGRICTGLGEPRDNGRIRLVKFHPTISGSVHSRTVKMLLTEAGQSNGKFCPRSNWKLVQLIITKSLDRFKSIYSLKCCSFIHCMGPN